MENPEEITFERFSELIDNATFTFAKSMPKIPHEYTVRMKWANQSDFWSVAKYIRDHGVEEKFFTKTFVYFYYKGHKYWTMGNPYPITKIINRAKE
jgi:hypothetical protein